MWFYVCFAALIKFCGGRLAGKLFPVVMAIGVATTALFYHSVLWYLPKFLFNPLVLEFSAGCLLYHGRHLMGDRMPLIMALAALAFLFFAIPAEFLGQNSIILADPKMAFYRTAVWGAFAVSLVGLVTQCDLKHHSAWPKFLLRLGDASYSIYLIAPLISLLLLITVQGTNKMLGYDFLSLTPFLSAIFYIMGTIFGGILLWKYFEVPATKKMKKLLSRFLPKPVPAIS
jgi:peptidoglycan/LPS O-acetylase OafA/YrhL